MRSQSPICPAHMAERVGGQTLAAGAIFGCQGLEFIGLYQFRKLFMLSHHTV
jgi:hypothetical protein